MTGSGRAEREQKEKWRALKEPFRTQRVRKRDRAPAGQAAPSETFAKRTVVRSEKWRTQEDSNL